MSNSRRILCGVVGWVGIMTVFALLQPPAREVSAQVKPKIELKDSQPKDSEKKKSDIIDAFSVNVDRDATNRIEAIKQYLLKKDPPYDQIVEPMQRMLESPQDSFIEFEKDGSKQKVSVRREVNRIIGQMPDTGRQFYQVTFGPRADARLKEALEKGDRVILAEVAQQFLHTKAGGEATVLLATYYLDRGDYEQAALTFEQLRLRNLKDTLPNPVLFKAAIAFRRAGDNANADKYWQLLKSSLGDKKELVLGARKFTMEELEKEFNKAMVTIRGASAAEYPMFRGDVTRNGQGQGGRPFFEPRLQYSMTPLDPDDKDERDRNKPGMDWIEQNLAASQERIKQTPGVNLPMFFPVGAAGKIIFRTYDGVYCYATKNDPVQGVKAGELSWKFLTDFSLFSMVKDASSKNMMENQYWRNFYMNQGPFGIFFENGLLGTMAHDGTNVYFVDDLAVPPHPQYAQNMGMNGMGRTNYGPFNEGVNHSRLIAVNIESGKKVWGLGSRTATPAPLKEGRQTLQTLFTDSHILGAPMPHAGKIYVVLEKSSELHLACLDPHRTDANGRAAPELVWSQKLGSPNLFITQDTMRRIQGVHLAFSSGMIIVPTNAGAVLGVDKLTHSLVWAHSYRESVQTPAEDPNNPKLPRRGGIVFNPGGINNQNLIGINHDRWRASAPMIVGDKVVFTAYDSNYITCLKLQDGETLWKVARTADDLYVAGVFDGKVTIVSRNQMRFLDLETGKPKGEPIATGVPSGVGAASNGMYLLPLRAAPDTKEPEIWSIDLAKGQVVARTKSRKKYVAGNLMFFEGDVFSQTAEKVSIFPQLNVKVQEMERLLKQNPKDPAGLVELGELRLDDGKLELSIADFRTALKNEPTMETRARAREKLFEAMTELLQQDFTKGETFLEEYRDLCNVPGKPDEELRRKANAFCLIAKGKETQGKLVEAFENYMAFGTLIGNQELISVIDQPNTQARPDVWSRGRILAMVRKATPEQRKPLEELVSKEWNAVRQANDTEKIRSFVKVFGGLFNVGSEARLFLAEKLLTTNNEEDVRDAENILLTLRSSDETVLAAKATESLARVWIRKGLMEDAVSLFEELGRKYPDVKIREDRTGADMFNDLITDKRFLPFLEPLKPVLRSNYSASEVPGQNPQQPQPAFTITPEGENLPFFNRYRLVLETNLGGTGQFGVRVVDRLTGEERFKTQPVPQPQYFYQYYVPQPQYKFAQVRGHLLLLNLNHMVYAYDLADKKKLWEYDLLGKNAVTNKLNPQAMVDADGTLRLIYSDGWTQRVGQIGVVESSYICLVTHDGLVALDPNRGSVLWTRTNVSPRMQVVGDESHVYIFEQNQDGTPAATRAVRADDGVSLEIPDCSNLFTKEKNVRTFGRNILVTQGKTVRLYDILKGVDVWKREREEGSLPIHSDDNRMMGYVTLKGEIAVFDVRTGKEVFTGKLDEKKVAEHLAKVDDILLLSDHDHFYLALNRPLENKNPNFNQNQTVQNGLRVAKVNGNLYCFEKSTGKRLWFSEEQFENQMIFLDQFADLPMIFAANNINRFNNNGVFEGNNMKAVALDKRTGKVKFRKDLQPNTQFYCVSNDPKTGIVDFCRYDLRIRFAPDPENKTGTPPTGKN